MPGPRPVLGVCLVPGPVGGTGVWVGMYPSDLGPGMPHNWHLVASTTRRVVGKRAICILLEYCLVYIIHYIILFITAHVVKRAKVMFSQAFVCPTRGWGRRWTAPKVNHLPPGHGQRSQHLPPPRVKGHNTSPHPGLKVTTPPPGTMHRRAVRILLECILVILYILNDVYYFIFSKQWIYWQLVTWSWTWCWWTPLDGCRTTNHSWEPSLR